MRGNLHVRFCSGGGVSDDPAYHNWPVFGLQKYYALSRYSINVNFFFKTVLQSVFFHFQIVPGLQVYPKPL